MMYGLQDGPNPAAATGATGATGVSGATGNTGPSGAPAGEGFKALIEDPKQVASKGWDYVEKYGPSVIAVLFIMSVAWLLSAWTQRGVRRGLERANFDLTLTKFLSNLVRWAILAIAVITCLGQFGFQTASFAALIGATGLALGLGFQGSLANLAAGVMLLVFRPFKVGDGIVVAGNTGLVNEIGLFTTELDTADGRRIIIPNGAIFGATIENSTYHGQRRVDITVAVAASADPPKVRGALLEAARSTKGVLTDPAPDVVLLDLTMSWSVQAWTKTGEMLAVRQALLESIKQKLGAAGIPGPRPVMDVTVTGLPDLARRDESR
jgi:small conductance mechanosensitive channel